MSLEVGRLFYNRNTTLVQKTLLNIRSNEVTKSHCIREICCFVRVLNCYRDWKLRYVFIWRNREKQLYILPVPVARTPSLPSGYTGLKPRKPSVIFPEISA